MLLKSNSGESNVLRWAASKHSVRNHTSTTKLLLEVFNQTFESKNLLLHNSTSPMNWFSYLSAALDIGLKHQTTFIPVLKYTPACEEHIQVLKSLVNLKWRFKGEQRLTETLLQLIAKDFLINLNYFHCASLRRIWSFVFIHHKSLIIQVCPFNWLGDSSDSLKWKYLLTSLNKKQNPKPKKPQTLTPSL